MVYSRVTDSWSKKNILRGNYHFVWVVLFFLVNGMNQQPGINFIQLLTLCLALSGFYLAFFLLSKFVFRSAPKAGLLTTLFAAFTLFFGVFEDMLGSIRWLTVVYSARHLILLATIFFLGFGYYLFKSTSSFLRFRLYLNVLLIVYVAIELAIAFTGAPVRTATPVAGKSPEEIPAKRPDIYLVVLDEYFGEEGMRNYFKTGNDDFYNFLRKKGFRIIDSSRSNYETTNYSIASMFNMDYLKEPGRAKLSNHYMYTRSFRHIDNNPAASFLQSIGYQVVNYSFFRIRGLAPAYKDGGLLPYGLAYVMSKTIFYRINKQLPIFLAEKLNSYYLADRRNKEFAAALADVPEEVSERLHKKDSLPRFAYIHLLMPHPPYLFNASGEPIVPYYRREKYSHIDEGKDYLQYMQYTNKVVEALVSDLLEHSNGQAVLMLMSDHGYRLASWHGDNSEYMFMNLNAVYLPKGFQDFWYDGMSNVNQFRVLFKSVFGERTVLLKDSLVYP